jgi:hypothetical protein
VASIGAMSFFWFRSLTHDGAQPCGQVGWLAVGVKQVGGPPDTGPSASQQRSPAPQHALPQQSEFPPHTPAVGEQGAGRQIPPAQSGVAPMQRTPHCPQFMGSFCGFTQPPPQHVRPVMHRTLHTPLPPAPVVPPAPWVPALPPALLPPVPAPPPPPPIPRAPPEPTESPGVASWAASVRGSNGVMLPQPAKHESPSDINAKAGGREWWRIPTIRARSGWGAVENRSSRWT